MADNDRRSILQGGLEACLRGEADALPKFFTEDVTVWSPNLFATSLEELTASIALREEALSDVNGPGGLPRHLREQGVRRIPRHRRLHGPVRHRRGHRRRAERTEILLGAALVAEFTGDKISALRNYFDDASLLEQMLVA